MASSTKIQRRTVLKGIAGAALPLPLLEAMGKEVVEDTPRRFCALYTANGMSLPKNAHGINQWSWFPTTDGKEFEFGESTKPLSEFRNQLSFMGGLYHSAGPKADHIPVRTCGLPALNYMILNQARITPSPWIRSWHNIRNNTAVNRRWSFRSMQALDSCLVPARFRITFKESQFRQRTIHDESLIDYFEATKPRWKQNVNS